jgi:hypothetical protein
MGTVLLQGVVGSHAYGLAGPDSDVDVLGMYAAPTVVFHGLNPPTGKQATTQTTDPDVTIHEAGKFARLLLGGNPTVTELLWLEGYTVHTELGERLIQLRDRVMCGKRVADAYLGYAVQQFTRLKNRGRFPDVPASRIEKHARHMLRLVDQGTHLWVTGQLVLRIQDPERVFSFAERVAAGDTEAAEWVIRRARETFDNVPTVLPAAPDTDAVQQWLLDVRAAHYTPDPARV